ncbi:response regulator [Leptolyngbya sp. FACHB-321]|uniref:hybrid sensor histidine kinase/response regulator n=1 Tax=Leptolyngbya sp. FACHB-321 TaxID=2692807 RepID=UPI00168465F7|nr:ATP-binding protein [Leptolyngbya sp. FACHB-321]MBD2036743.1 response regulator [Leptolyngbya sp. FACHB-321]
MSAKILVVEDEPIIALDLQQQLTKLGYTVVAIADCAEQALAAAARYQPHLALMDIRIRGDKDGIETAALLSERYSIPIVFLTAHADAATIQQVKAVQPYGYIVKPFEIHNLSTAIEIALTKHEAEKVTQAALEKEKELNRLKSNFIEVVSHEFRNPLSAILLALDLLERHDRQLTIEKKQVYLQRARVAVSRMMQLLEEVLVSSQIDAGKLTYNPEPLLVEAFCRQLVADFQLAIDTKADPKHTITFTQIGNTVDRPTLCNLDEKLLHHILTNLLSNAIKYSPHGGSVTFKLIHEAESITFQIHDCGIGIPKGDCDQLFNRFYRASNAKTIPGTGLGLSIAKQCVDAHYGNITVQSAIGIGTTFTVTLPLLVNGTPHPGGGNGCLG